MDHNFRNKTIAGLLVGANIFGLTNSEIYANKDRLNDFHDFGDASSVLFSAFGATLSSSQIDLTPNTAIEKQYYNLDADYSQKYQTKKSST